MNRFKGGGSYVVGGRCQPAVQVGHDRNSLEDTAEIPKLYKYHALVPKQTML